MDEYSLRRRVMDWEGVANVVACVDVCAKDLGYRGTWGGNGEEVKNVPY